MSKYKLYFICYLLFFSLIYGIYVLYYNYLYIPNFPLVQVLLAIVSVFFIRIFGRKWGFFNKIKNTGEIFILTFLLLFLFAVNNYLIINYDEITVWKTKYKDTTIAPILLSYIFSSISEEITYRGFIQNYINDKIGNRKDKILTKGNWVATFIMTAIHLGFLAYLNLIFAITSIALVFIFSLVAGYIMDKTKNIIIPIIIHVLANFVHYFVCIGGINNYI